MKVVQINSSCEFGSTGRIAMEISKKLNEKQIENYILYSGNRKSTYENGILINSKFDIRVHQILSRLMGDQGWHSFYATLRLIHRLKKLSPSIIHLHNLHGYYLHMDKLFSYLSRTDAKIIWTLHDCWAFTGHCSHFTKVECEKWRTQCSFCPQRREYPYSLLIDRSRSLFLKKKKLYQLVPNMVVTTVSKWLGIVTSESKLLSNHPIFVIPNGVDTKVFYPQKRVSMIKGIDVQHKQIILGVANSWSERKGLSDFRLLAQLLPKEFIIVLVGVKKDQKMNMPNNVICVEHTDSKEELAKLYSSALAFFNASLEETFGLTTIEALACGTPAIVYQSTACAEVITSNTGYVLNPGDINGVLRSIMEIYDKGKTIYSYYCRAHAVEKYDIEKTYEKYIKLYGDELEVE